MKLYKVSITKDKLGILTDKEKILFVQLSNLFDEINILHRALLCSNVIAKTNVETRAQNTQSLFFLEILAGKLWEGWEMLGRDYFGSKLSRDYYDALSIEGKEALREISHYFNKGNLINKIRSNYAFHYGKGVSARIRDRIDEIEDDGENDIYLSEWTGNSFFYFAEMIVTSSMLNEINPDDDWHAITTLFDEVLGIAKKYLAFLPSCITAILEKYDIASYEEIEIPDPPTINELRLPWFIRKS